MGVDDHRAEAKFGAPGAKPGGFAFRDARAYPRPHARAGGENLQCVAAELRGAFERACEAMGDGSMNADTNAAVAPGGSLSLGRGFGEVLLAVIVGEGKILGPPSLVFAGTS